jgi:nucleolar MIF4G domain-containing protein 1
MSHEPLRITLEDLHSAESKGKWWLVGAAWSGDPLVDNRARFEEQGVGQTTHSGTEDKLMKLAKKHGMNTDIRRSIFVVIMSSEVRSIKILWRI